MAQTLTEVANRYKVLATLGEGGMGTVYLVEDTTNGQQVALKVLSGQQGMDANALLQFKQEFRVMAKLKHPNNCAVYDYGLLGDGTPYFTMEVVPGKGLDEIIPVDPDNYTAILSQICQALGYIHQQGFVHCDLKPENIRIKPDGSVKLMDFGLMEVAGQSGGAIKGTLAYIAPEVAKRDRIDQRSDLYSLGAVTYQLLTGETPFKGANPIEVLRAHLNQQPRPLRELNARIPALMEQVVLKLMAKEPVARYQSSFDVLNALGIEVDDSMGATLLASAFVGRQGELAKLQSALVGVKRDRRGQTLWMTGAAGIGKSRILGEFRFSVQLEELPFLAGACTEQKVPYGPFIEVLRSLLPLAKEACPNELNQYAPLLSKLLPELADGRALPALEPEQEKIMLQTAISTLLLKAAERGGAVVVLENWELADALSADALTYLLRNAADAPLLLVISTRDAAQARGELIELPALTATETAEIAKSMLGGAALPSGLATQIADLTGGNPQFVTTLLEHLVRNASLTRAKGKWILPEAIAPEQLPADLSDLLFERFANLSEPALKVAQLAAVLGAPFALKIVTDLLGLSEDTLFDALDELLQSKILVVDSKLYSFASAELKDALYGKLTEELRLDLHAAAATYLEAALPQGEPEIAQISAVAHHYLGSRHHDKAVLYAYRAAMRLKDLQAMDAVLALLEAGNARFAQLPQDGEWQTLRCDYLIQLADAALWKSRLEDTEKYLLEGEALANQLNDKGRLLALMGGRIQFCAVAGSSERLKEGIALYEPVVKLADELGEVKKLLRATGAVGRCLFFSGQNARALEVFEEAARIAKDAELDFWLARALCFMGYLRVAAGEATREQGFADLDEATQIQERVADKYGLGYTLNLQVDAQMHGGRFREAEHTAINHAKIMHELGATEDHTISLLNHSIVLLEMGQFERAIAVGNQCLELARKHKNKMAEPIQLATLGSAHLYRGDLKQAEELLIEGQAAAKEANAYVYSLIIPNLIEAWLFLGRLQKAISTAQEARDLVSSTGNTAIETRLWVSMGEIHARLGEEPAARSYFERARDHAKKGDEQHIVARAEKGLAWMDLLQGQLDAAEPQLARALGLSRALPLRYVEAECYALQGAIALARNAQGEAFGNYEESAAIAAELGARPIAAIALHGQSRSAKPAQAKELLDRAKELQQSLMETLDEESQQAYLSFMERAQLARDEGKPAVAEVAAIEAAPALPETASNDERSAWLQREIAAAAQSQHQEAVRLATIAKEFEQLSKGAASDARVAELEASNRRMEQLIKFSLAVSNVQDLEKVLEQAVDLIVEITAAERGFLLFFENGQIRSQVSRVNVDRRSPMDWQFSKSIAEKVLTTGEVVCVFDALSDVQFNQSKSIVDLNLRTVICVPMRIKGKMIGAIYVDRQSINENFGPEDLELVMSLAAQAAGAIDNARMHQEWIDKSKRLEMLNLLSKTISSSLEMEEVLDLIVKMTLEVSRAERGFLFLLDDDRRRLICRAARDLRGSLPLDEDHEISQSICTKVLSTGEAQNVADAMNDEEFQFQQSIMALNLRMVMCVPIAAKGQIIGLLYVDSQAVVNAFSDKDLDLLNAIAGHASVAIENAKLHARTMRLADDLQKTFYSFVNAMGASIDAKHPLTAGHSFRVTEYGVRLARRMGLPPEEVENIRIAGLLHDVGKIGTPDHILMKPGSFTNEEYEIMKKHVVHTREILDTIYFPENQRHIPAVAGAHHEKWDGKGYPNNQAGEDIPLGGRILALGDVFDAITSKRDYREAMPLAQALNIIRQGIGTHFDPALAPEFIQMIEEEGVVYYEKELQDQPSEMQQA
ncbi:MAG TPA: HD domain-containing phosphohydrolase [Oscillatoriaceae cyanobacterium]